jgi:hypothetical protein
LLQPFEFSFALARIGRSRALVLVLRAPTPKGDSNHEYMSISGRIMVPSQFPDMPNMGQSQRVKRVQSHILATFCFRNSIGKPASFAPDGGVGRRVSPDYALFILAISLTLRLP